MNKKNLTDEELLLTKDIQKDSSTFLSKVEKIYEVKKQLKEKKRIAGTEIARLETELAKLDKEYIFETDQEKIRELAKKKKDIRYEIEEYQSILSTKYNPIIKDMLKDIENYLTEAEKEKRIFDCRVEEKRKQYQEEREEFMKTFQEKIDNLDTLHFKHNYSQAYNKYWSIKMDKTDW